MNYNLNFSKNTPKLLAELLIIESGMNDNFQLINVVSYHPNLNIKLVVDGEKGQSFSYLERYL